MQHKRNMAAFLYLAPYIPTESLNSVLHSFRAIFLNLRWRHRQLIKKGKHTKCPLQPFTNSMETMSHISNWTGRDLKTLEIRKISFST